MRVCAYAYACRCLGKLGKGGMYGRCFVTLTASHLVRYDPQL